MWREELNGKVIDMAENEIYCKELEEALSNYELEMKISGMIADERMETLEKSGNYHKWEVETGYSGEKGRKYITSMIMQSFTSYLSQGILQLTIESVMEESACRDAVEKHKETAVVVELHRTLDPFRIHIDVVPKVGMMEVSRIRYNFDIESEIEVKDTKVVMEDATLKSITFGSLFTDTKIYAVSQLGRRELCNVKGSLKSPRTITV